MHSGQVIQLRKQKPIQYSAAPIIKPMPVITPVVSASDREPSGPVHWLKPASGRVRPYSRSNRGINIFGTMGAPVYAAGSGKVVYSGNGLRGYGNLIIIKHNASFLSAYAYNRKNLVSEGDWVRGGQKIAEMGVGESGSPMLHFEIRLAGKPVDPAFYLNQS